MPNILFKSITLKIRYAIIILTFVSGILICMSKTAKASDKYLVKINKQQNCVTIYEKEKSGNYKPFKAMVCSTGVDTPLGTFGLKEKIRWHELDGPVYGQYCTRITGHILFHSVWYHVNGDPATLSNYQYNRLGSAASHGCVRLSVQDAKWVYDNIPFGTSVTIYNSANPGPLGKPKAIKLSGSTGWDPTDTTNPNNPYNKKKPTLKVEGGNITYASDFDLLKGVEAKNTTGFDAKNLLTYTIEHKVKGEKNFKRVKNINTKSPGIYRVKFTLTDEIGRTVKKNATYKVLTKVSVKSIMLNKASRTLYLGGEAAKKSYRLKVQKVKPNTASIKEVSYTSSNKKVITVSDKGIVKAKGVGTAEVTAVAQDGSGKKAVCKFTVKRYAKSITLSASTTTIAVNQAIDLKTTVSPKTTTNKNVAFTSSDSSIAVVSADGRVTGLKPGIVTITAKAKDGSNKQAAIQITIACTFASVATNHMGEVRLSIGTPLANAMAALPTVIAVKDTNGNIGSATITWTIPAYNPTAANKYTAIGTLTLPTGWIGAPEPIGATVIVGNPEEVIEPVQ